MESPIRPFFLRFAVRRFRLLLFGGAVWPAASAFAAAGTPGTKISSITGFVLWAVTFVAGLYFGWLWHRTLARRSVEPEKLVNDLASPALLLDAKGQLLATNAAASRLFSFRGTQPADALPPAVLARIQSCITARTIESGFESKILETWLAWTLEPMPDRQVRVHVADVTDRHHREHDLTRERDAAREASRLTGDFVSTVSHDIRVPMNGVLGMANLLLETELTAHQRELARAVVESADAVITLTDELLDLAKMEAGKLEVNPQPTELTGLLDDLLRAHAARAAEKHLDLSCNLAPTLPSLITIDPVRLRQILANLLSNALKFTDRGEVVLRVWTETPAKGGPELRFAVRDTGIGIAADKRDRLFQAFSQADSSTYRTYGGTGLGLFTSRQLAELMHGRVWFESEPGQGSIFYLALPYQPVPGSPPPVWSTVQTPLQRKIALVVEDNSHLAELFLSWFTRWGAQVVEFGSASETSAWLGGNSRFDIALIDLDLPSGTGLGLVEAFGRLQFGPRRIAMSARPPDATAALAGVDVLLKPVGATALLECLQRAPAPPKQPAATTRPVAIIPVSAPAPAAAPAGPRANVLVADDDAINQKVMRTYLERLGCHVRLAANGREALEALDAAPCDVLFLDIMMPQLDGLQAVREIRRNEAEHAAAGRKTARLPVVAITAKVMPGDREAGLSAGFDDYATKPINEPRLREVLRKFVPGFAGAPAASAGGATDLAAAGSPVDRSRITELGSGDVFTIREIVSLYFQKTEGLVPELETLIRAGNLSEARRIAHTGAGSSVTCGMIQVQAAFRRVEHAIEAGQTDQARALLGEVRHALAASRGAVADLLPAAS